MIQKIKENLKLLSIPLMLLGVYLFSYLLYYIFGSQSEADKLIMVKEWFSSHGLWVVFVGALIEGFLLLGQYFPGGLIIFISVISTVGDITRAVIVVLIVCVSFFIAYTLNYLVGRYGWYKLLLKFGLGDSIENSKIKLEKHGLNTVFFTYWEPNLSSITATTAGILGISFKKFSLYSAGGIILWNTFWGVLVYNLGDSALKLMGFKYVLTIFFIWIMLILVKKYFFTRSETLQL